MSDDDLICICMSVTRGEIKKAMGEGQTSLDSLKSTLFCCTGCGTCESRVRAVMDEAIATKAEDTGSETSPEKKAG